MYQRPVRNRFARNPYTVDNVPDVWECDLLDLQSLGKYNDMHRYIRPVIEEFSKFLHLVPLKTKSGPSIASAVRCISHNDDDDLRRRSPVSVCPDKGKEFLNDQFQNMLRDEGIQFQVSINRTDFCDRGTCSLVDPL